MDNQDYELIMTGIYTVGAISIAGIVFGSLTSMVKSRYKNSPDSIKSRETIEKYRLDLDHKYKIDSLPFEERCNIQEITQRAQLLEISKEELIFMEDVVKKRLEFMKDPYYIAYISKRDEAIEGMKEGDDGYGNNIFDNLNNDDLERTLEKEIGPNPLKGLFEDYKFKKVNLTNDSENLGNDEEDQD